MAGERIDPGAQFLHEQNRRLHTSDEVLHVVGYLSVHGARIGEKPAQQIAAYMDFLAQPEYVNHGILTNNADGKARLLGAAVLPEPTVPPGEKPTADQRKIRTARAGQLASLAPWANYLGSNEAGYPDWFRLYAFDAVTRLRPYDTFRRTLPTRTARTRAGFPQLDHHAVDLTYHMLDTYKIRGEQVPGGYEDEVEEETFQVGLRSASFRVLYAHALRTIGTEEITDDMLAVTNGMWQIYPAGSDPRVLFLDQQGFGLNWCTTTNFKYARSYVRRNDMHVFYSDNPSGDAPVPRLTVVVRDNEVAEVRGIDKDQEVETILIDELSAHLSTLSGSERFLRQAADLKRLQELQAKVNANPLYRFTKEELLFAYELRRDIQTFALQRPTTMRHLRQKQDRLGNPVFYDAVPEGVQAQFPAAYAGYVALCDQLRQQPVAEGRAKALFRAQHRNWMLRGVYDYLIREIAGASSTLKSYALDGPCSYTLVATPNSPVNYTRLQRSVDHLYRKHPDEEGLGSDFYKGQPYTPTELAGVRGVKPLRFGLMGARIMEEFEKAESVPSMREVLRSIRRATPEVYFDSPSVLEAISFWYALRAQGTDLINSQVDDERTAISHIRYPWRTGPHHQQNTYVVPYTFVGTVEASPDIELGYRPVKGTHYPRLLIS